MSDIIYSWRRVTAEQAEREHRPPGPRLIESTIGHITSPAEVSIVEIEGKPWIDLDSGYDNSPPIPVADMLWLLAEAGFRIDVAR